MPPEIYWSSNAETLDDWDVTSAWGTGYLQLIEAGDREGLTPYQGTYSLETGAEPDPGYAQCRKVIVPEMGDGDEFHFGWQFQVCRNYDLWPDPKHPYIPSSTVHLLHFTNADLTECCILYLSYLEGASAGKKVGVYVSAAAQHAPLSEIGFTIKTWHKCDLYVKLHNTAGFVQFWADDNLWCELAGVDTYNGATVNRICNGLVYKGDNESEVCTYWDAMVWDDAKSPLPPGNVARGKVYSSLAQASPLVRGGLVR